jgi:hypothetical protein
MKNMLVAGMLVACAYAYGQQKTDSLENALQAAEGAEKVRTQ